MKSNYRLRYAPSPTGYLHIGNTRTALMNYLFAKKYHGSFIVRIEDTDQARNVAGAIESQFDNLNWLGINPDESFLQPGLKEYGKYQQSEKFAVYVQHANKLIDQGFAYRCFCTPDEIERDYQLQIAKGVVATKYSGKCKQLTKQTIQHNLANNLKYSIRFIVQDQQITFDDFVKGQITFDTKAIGDFVILKSDGIATYNFAVVIDDHDMQISHVLRGEEHISNTPRQILIYQALKWTIPLFGHLSLIIDDHGQKLSKRSGNQMFFIEQYRTQGYLPAALFNYIALLGWSPKGEQELFTPQELIDVFDDQRFSKSPSTFDMHKMRWVNAQYIKKLTTAQYLSFVKPFIDHHQFPLNQHGTKWWDAVLSLFAKEVEFGAQINDFLPLFFRDLPFTQQLGTLLSSVNDASKVINEFHQHINHLTQWDVEHIKQILKIVGEKTNCKGKNLFMPIRISATCAEHGPSLVDTIFLLGKTKVLNNIAKVNGENHGKSI